MTGSVLPVWACPSGSNDFTLLNNVASDLAKTKHSSNARRRLEVVVGEVTSPACRCLTNRCSGTRPATSPSTALRIVVQETVNH